MDHQFFVAENYLSDLEYQFFDIRDLVERVKRSRPGRMEWTVAVCRPGSHRQCDSAAIARRDSQSGERPISSTDRGALVAGLPPALVARVTHALDRPVRVSDAGVLPRADVAAGRPVSRGADRSAPGGGDRSLHSAATVPQTRRVRPAGLARAHPDHTPRRRRTGVRRRRRPASRRGNCSCLSATRPPRAAPRRAARAGLGAALRGPRELEARLAARADRAPPHALGPHDGDRSPPVRIENRGWRDSQRGSVTFHSSPVGCRSVCAQEPRRARISISARW